MLVKDERGETDDDETATVETCSPPDRGQSAERDDVTVTRI